MAEITDLDPTDANNTGRWPENMAFSAVNNAGRADEGLLARWFRDTSGSLTASGSGNAFAVTSNRTIASLVNNTLMGFTANHSITGASTLNLNGLGAVPIKRFNGADLASGDIISGQPILVLYKSSPNVWFMMTAPAALIASMFADFSENVPANPAADVARLYALDVGGSTLLAYRDSAGLQRILRAPAEASGALLAILEDNKSSGTAGGTFSSGDWRTRDLNTEVYDRLGIFSIAANQFTISAAGDYEIEWHAPGHACGSHASRLFDVTGAAAVKQGSSQFNGTGSAQVIASSGLNRVTIAGARTFRIEHRCSSTRNDDGFGEPAGFGTEVYTRVIIRRG